jgi:hypothetical protein
MGLEDNTKVTKDSDHPAGTLETEKTGLFAEENQFDRRTMWRIGTWGMAAVAAVVVAVMANQASLGLRRDQLAAADLSRQAQQLQSAARDSQNEARRLAAAIDTLNNDRDRLFSRVTVVEQGLDSVTGAIGRQNSAGAPAASPGSAPATPKSSAMGPTPVTVPSDLPEFQPAPAAQATLPAIGPVATAATVPTTPGAAPVAAEKPRLDSAKSEVKTEAKTDVKSEVKSDIKVVRPESKPDLKPEAKSEAKPEVRSEAKSSEVKSSEIRSPEAKLSEAKPSEGKSSEAKPSDPKSAVKPDSKSEAKAEPKPDTKPTSRPDQVSHAPSSAVHMAANTASPAAATPASTTMTTASISMMGPPDPAAPKLEPVKSANAGPPLPPMANAMASVTAKDSDSPDAASDKRAVLRTEFAVDLGTANSVNGLRALWRSLRSNASLADLHPIIVIKEGNTGLGMQLRLAAGPLRDAAAAARICAVLVEGERTCETTVYDGQRLAMSSDEAQPPGVKPLPGANKSYQYRRYPPRHTAPASAAKKEEPPPPPQPPKPEPSSISSLFKR